MYLLLLPKVLGIIIIVIPKLFLSLPLVPMMIHPSHFHKLQVCLTEDHDIVPVPVPFTLFGIHGSLATSCSSSSAHDAITRALILHPGPFMLALPR